MYIQEAIKARIAGMPFISRKKWRDELSTWRARNIKIEPTDSPDCCIIRSKINSPHRGWQPTMEDLTADDWIVVP